jgi:hypothetical protein
MMKLLAFTTVVAMGACLITVCSSTGNGAGMVICTAAQETAAGHRQTASLRRLSELDLKTFASSLSQLRQAIDQAGPQATVDPATLATITAKLRQTPESAPEYWPTVLRFIQFASSRMAPNAPPPGQKPRALSEIVSVGLMRGIREDRRTILFDDGELGNGEFTNCRIIFTQHPVQLTHATFRHCAFELPTTDAPSPYLQKVCRLLLSSNLDSVSIPVL